MKAKKLVFPPAPDGTPRTGSSTNLMLWSYEGSLGVKTGFTAQALLTYVAAAEREDRRLYAVLLGSDGDGRILPTPPSSSTTGSRSSASSGTPRPAHPMSPSKADRLPTRLISLENMETYLHLAGQGLMLDSPSPLRALPEPAPPPIVEVTRNPDPAPRTVMETMRFWLDLALGVE